MNNKYEVLLLIKPNLDKEELNKIIKNVETKLGGNIVKKEEWGEKTLAYTIKKFKKAYYILYYVETSAENIDTLRKMILITKEILRPMILRHEKKWPYEYKTAAELKFPERKPRKEFSRNDSFKKNFNNTNSKTDTTSNVEETSEKKDEIKND